MELATEPDTYSPNIDDNGNYVDKIPSFYTNALANGLRCPCGTRKDKVYTSSAMFSAHIKTKTHNKWLSDLNTNKMNFYSECEKLKEVVNSQKIIIAKLEKEVNTKLKTIDYLTQKLMNKDNENIVNDLISFD